LRFDHPRGGLIFTGFDQLPGKKLSGVMKFPIFLPPGNSGVAGEGKEWRIVSGSRAAHN
jgi:hypothetical protein